MKIKIFLLATIVTAAHAQNIGIKDIPANENTTIEIKKGVASKDAEKKKEKLYEIIKEEEEIEGDSAVLEKEARKNWKVACSEWKKDLQDRNKDNKIISLNCGKVTCSSKGVESVCTSQGKFIIKTSLD